MGFPLLVLQIARADRLAAVVLGALLRLHNLGLDMSAQSIAEIAGAHHAVLVEELLDLRGHNVAHRMGEKSKVRPFWRYRRAYASKSS